MKLRGTRDLSVAAVGKYGTLQEFSFFDKVGGCCSWVGHRGPLGRPGAGLVADQGGALVGGARVGCMWAESAAGLQGRLG